MASALDVRAVDLGGERWPAPALPMSGGRLRPAPVCFHTPVLGLVRELGIPAATAISLRRSPSVNTFINFNAGLTAFNQADMTLPLLLGAGVWLVAMFAYKYLLEAIPRAGGEYVYSPASSPALGAMFWHRHLHRVHLHPCRERELHRAVLSVPPHVARRCIWQLGDQ